MNNKKRGGLGAEMMDKWINICCESMRLDFSSPEHTESQAQSMSVILSFWKRGAKTGKPRDTVALQSGSASVDSK